MIQVTESDIGRRVKYRPAPSATETLSGTITKMARCGKEPGVYVTYDGREEPSLVYCSRLEWETG